MPPDQHPNGDTRRNPEGRALYRCDHCGKVEPWNDSWAWYGSYRQAEDYGLKGVAPVRTMCSAECRIAMIAAGTLPADGLDDGGEVIDERAEKQKRRTLREKVQE